MIVVVIIGILAAVGIPQYQNYVARSQAAEGFSLAGGLRTALAEYHDTHGVFPDSTTDAHTAIGIEPAGNIIGKYITGVVVSDDGSGTITATFGPASQHDGKFLRLTPTATDGAVYFDCTTDIEESYRPSGCEESTGTGGASGTSDDSGTSEDTEIGEDVSEDPAVAITPSGTAYGTSWSGLTAEEKKCGAGSPAANSDEPAECQFDVCWSGTATKGEWVVGSPSGFRADKMYELRKRMYSYQHDKWKERDESGVATGVMLEPPQTDRRCIGGDGSVDNSCRNQKCSST